MGPASAGEDPPVSGGRVGSADALVGDRVQPVRSPTAFERGDRGAQLVEAAFGVEDLDAPVTELDHLGRCGDAGVRWRRLVTSHRPIAGESHG